MSAPVTIPRLVVVVCVNDRAVRKYVRGFLAESADSELAGSTGADLGVNEPVAVEVDGGATGVRWQRPVLSAPNVVTPTLTNPSGRLCVWALWDSTLTDAGRDRLTALAQAFAQIRVFRQRQSEGETIEAFNARWRAAVGTAGWIDRPEDAQP